MSTETPAPQSIAIFQSTGPQLHVERYDARSPAAVLIHGGGDGTFAWDLFAPALARRFTTLAIDLRGHGDSGWDPSARYHTEHFVSDVAQVIEQSELGDLILVGHSLGAEVAIHLRALYPECVVASVLIDYAPEMNPEGIDRATELIRQSLTFYPTVDRYAEWLEQTRLLADPSLLDHIARRSLRPDGDGFRLKLDPAIGNGFADLVQSQSPQQTWKLLQHQSCPTLLVRGAGSAVLPPATARRLVALLPHGELATVNASGHSVMLDNPAEFERVVFGFLEKVLRVQLRGSTHLSLGP